jgi:hypothetical protein
MALVRRLDRPVSGAAALAVAAAAPALLVSSGAAPSPAWAPVLADAVIVCGLTVAATLGGLDAALRGDGRSLPMVAAAAAIAALWAAHLAALAGLGPQPAAPLLVAAQAGTPAALGVALLLGDRAVHPAEPRLAAAVVIAAGVAVGLSAAGVASAPNLPALVASGRLAGLARLLAAAAALPALGRWR